WGSGSKPPPAPNASEAPPAPGGEPPVPSPAPTRLSPLPPAAAPATAEAAPRTRQYGPGAFARSAPFGPSATSKTYSGLGPDAGERPLTLDLTPRGDGVAEKVADPEPVADVQRISVVPQRVVSIGAPAPTPD